MLCYVMLCYFCITCGVDDVYSSIRFIHQICFMPSHDTIDISCHVISIMKIYMDMNFLCQNKILLQFLIIRVELWKIGNSHGRGGEGGRREDGRRLATCACQVTWSPCLSVWLTGWSYPDHNVVG